MHPARSFGTAEQNSEFTVDTEGTVMVRTFEGVGLALQNVQVAIKAAASLLSTHALENAGWTTILRQNGGRSHNHAK